MKKIAVIALLLGGCFLVGNGYAQEAPQKAAGRTAAPKTKEPRHAGSGHLFSGRVARVDVASKTFSLKDKGTAVGFDASNPIFSGYQSLSDMRIGDPVAVSYTPEGIRVRKLSGAAARGKEVAEEKAGSGKSTPKTTRTREGLIKTTRTGDGTGFDDADVNKDGKVTTVELSVVIKQITVDEFKQYDRNNDGCLNRAEFIEAVKHLKTRDR